MAAFKNIVVARVGHVTTVMLNRPAARNAVDALTASELRRAFTDFDQDDNQRAAVFHAAGDTFCGGADLKALSRQDDTSLKLETLGPMGPTSLELSKPVIAAVQGYAVAGGLELALWADLRVADETAKFGVFCRRFGVPLIDGGTVRLPRLIGHSRAMDLILTGREVPAKEALDIGLANRLVPAGGAYAAALALAEQLCRFPQQTMRDDRRLALEQWGSGRSAVEHMKREQQLAVEAAAKGEVVRGATQFSSGAGRGGSKL